MLSQRQHLQEKMLCVTCELETRKNIQRYLAITVSA